MAVMKASEFVAKLKDVAQNYKTLYVMGCFGAPLTGGNVSRYCNNHAYNKQAARTKMIKAAANQNPPVFGFDCVCLIKGILWGWRGDASKTYGGASYAVNGVPDIGADTMITKCKGVSTNFSNVEVGEALWCSGHIGVYIGGGLAVECSPAFENDVQITAVKNMGTKSGYNARTWTKHGKLPYIEYDNAALCQVSSQNPACALYRGQIRRMVIVYRSRHCYDMEFCFPQLCLICSELHFRLADHIIPNLVGRINAGLIQFDLFCV